MDAKLLNHRLQHHRPLTHWLHTMLIGLGKLHIRGEGCNHIIDPRENILFGLMLYFPARTVYRIVVLPHDLTVLKIKRCLEDISHCLMRDVRGKQTGSDQKCSPSDV